jgi:FtsH-binding integral membrane protein
MSTSEASGTPGEGLQIAPPSPLRLAGFLATAMGALGLGMGAVMTWVTVPSPADTGGNVDIVYKGLDIGAGKVAILAALVLLVGMMALRGARTRRGETAIAVVMIVAAAAGATAALYVLVFANRRYGLPDQPTVSRGLGVILASAGGIIAILGAVLDLAWARAPQAAPSGSDADGTPGRPTT